MGEIFFIKIKTLARMLLYSIIDKVNFFIDNML